MRKFPLFSMALLIAVSVASANAVEGVSIERGKELFESAKLGTSGKSCATCHPGGKGLEWAGTSDDEKLEEISNKCIKKALQGKPLKEGSNELRSLVQYIKTFARPN